MFEYLIRHKTKIQHLHKPKNIFTSNNGGSGTGGSGTGGSGATSATALSGTFSVDIASLNFSEATNGLTDTVTDTSKNGKYKIANGTTLANGYFTVVQSSTSSTTYYTDKNRTQINAIELDKQSNNSYIKFTVTGTAAITVSATSTGSNNKSYVEIVSENGTATKATCTEVLGTSPATTITKNCSAGTYWIVVWTDSTDKSLARITSLSAVQSVN